MSFCVCVSELIGIRPPDALITKALVKMSALGFGWGDDLSKHAPARHGSPLPFGRTRSKRIVDDPARNQCLGARSLGQTLVKLDRAESRRRTLGRGTSLLTEVIPRIKSSTNCSAVSRNQRLRHFLELVRSISEYHLIC